MKETTRREFIKKTAVLVSSATALPAFPAIVSLPKKSGNLTTPAATGPNILLITTCSLFIFSCNINPSKEARIKSLETEIKQTITKINNLESKVKLLESSNEQLKSRIIELENK